MAFNVSHWIYQCLRNRQPQVKILNSEENLHSQVLCGVKMNWVNWAINKYQNISACLGVPITKTPICVRCARRCMIVPHTWRGICCPIPVIFSFPQSFNSYDWAKFKMYFYDNIITIYFLLPKHYNNGTGEKPHVCTVCHKKFSTTSSLNTHQRIHSGEKPHKCFICGKCFTASSNLYYHKMIHFTVRLLIDTYVWIIMKYAYQYCLHISACLFISSDYFRNYFDFRRNHINVATVRNHFQHQEICGPISTSIRVIGPSIARYAREDLLNRQTMSHTNTQSQWY